MRFIAAAALLAGLSAAAPAEDMSIVANRQNADINIKSVSVTGTGCPSKSADVTFDPALQAFVVDFSKYTAQTGPAPLGPGDSRKNCKITLDVGFTQGYSFAILATDLEGFAELDAGVTGKATTDMSFVGGTGKPHCELDFKGPFDNEFDLPCNPDVITYSTCGPASAILNINTAVSLNPLAPGPKKGLIGVDDFQGYLRQVFHVNWRRC